MNPQSITRAWRRSSPHGEQLVRVHVIVVRTGPTADVFFVAGRQHRFGDPRYYEWSGWDEEEHAFDDGRALPFDLVVGPPRPSFRSSAYEANEAMTDAIDEVDAGLERARIESAGDGINTIDLFHPMIVVAAPIHAVNEDGSTIPLTTCRLDRQRVAALNPGWIDIVREPALPETLAALFSAYGCLLQRLRCMPAVA